MMSEYESFDLSSNTKGFNSSSNELFLHNLFDPSVVDPSFKADTKDLVQDLTNLNVSTVDNGELDLGNLINDTEVYVLLTLATLFFTVFLVVLYLVSELMHKAIRGNTTTTTTNNNNNNNTGVGQDNGGAQNNREFLSVLVPSDLSSLAQHVLSRGAREGEDTLKRRDPPPPYDNPPPYTEAYKNNVVQDVYVV